MRPATVPRERFSACVPRKANPATADPQRRISKTGDSCLRSLLVQSAQYILGRFGPDSELRRWGLKLAATGGKRGKKRAIVAVARKLAVVLHAMWRSGQRFQAFPTTGGGMAAYALCLNRGTTCKTASEAARSEQVSKQSFQSKWQAPINLVSG
jgi:hypothetical protein